MLVVAVSEEDPHQQLPVQVSLDTVLTECLDELFDAFRVSDLQRLV